MAAMGCCKRERVDSFRLQVNEHPQPVVVRSAFAPGEG